NDLPKRRKRWPYTKIVIAGVVVLSILAAGLALYLRPKPFSSEFADSHATMVLVPAGTFAFGENASDSRHQRLSISLPAFYVDKTEVSNAEYSRFVEATQRQFSGRDYATGHPDQPVTNVSEADAAAYAAGAGKRLPTEQEWEKAARGTDGRTFPWGADPWTQNVPQQLQSVDSFPDRKSPYGAMNMAGNAWEWT